MKCTTDDYRKYYSGKAYSQACKDAFEAAQQMYNDEISARMQKTTADGTPGHEPHLKPDLAAGVSWAIRCTFPLDPATRLSHIIRALVHLFLDGKSAHLMVAWLCNSLLVLLWMLASVVVAFVTVDFLELTLAATDVYKQSTIQHALGMLLTYNDL